MKRFLFVGLAAAVLGLVAEGKAHAWGRGGFAVGGYHAGSFGGYRGGYAVGGYHAAAVGGYRGGYDFGGYYAAAVGGYRGYDVGGYRATMGAVGVYRGGVAVGGYHAGAVGVGRVGVAGDFGVGRVAGVGRAGYVAVGHSTRYYSSGVLAARGVAVRGGFYRYGAFNTGWWTAHPGAWRPAAWAVGTYWAAATWPSLGDWWGWTAPPVYYDYGTTIVYQNNEVVVNGQPEATATQYYDQAADLAQANPPVDKKDDEWKPLGVFGLVQGEQSDANAVFQLAVNKAGTIRGNYTSVLDGTTLPVHGSVDRKTQRAAWMVGDNKTTVYDTGIYNLTKDEAPLLIHFGKDRTQEWLLVRIQQGDADAPPAVPPAEEAPQPLPPGGDATGHVTVHVPADAELWFDGSLTTQTGTDRLFVTPPLEKGLPYYYTIRTQWTENGNPVQQIRKVAVRAGGNVRVDFPGSEP